MYSFSTILYFLTYHYQHIKKLHVLSISLTCMPRKRNLNKMNKIFPFTLVLFLVRLSCLLFFHRAVEDKQMPIMQFSFPALALVEDKPVSSYTSCLIFLVPVPVWSICAQQVQNKKKKRYYLKTKNNLVLLQCMDLYYIAGLKYSSWHVKQFNRL